jgi:endo-1,4-beta-xylanase
MLTRRDFFTRGAGAALALTAISPAALIAEDKIASVVNKQDSTSPSEDISGSRSLNAHAKTQGRVFGSAVIVKNIREDPKFAKIIREQCGIVVTTGELKWIALRPSRDKYDFNDPDYLLNFAQQNHMLMRGHNLCWHESVPDWIKTEENKPHTRQFFIDHITTVCKRYAGHFQSWDVVNEAILPKDGQPGGLRKSFWYEQMGPEYIELAFRTAYEADPYAKLTYNDYGVELDNEEDTERRKLILDLLRDLKKRSVPVHAVGIQSHVKAGSTFGKGLSDYIENLRQMDFEVYLTELDVNEDDIVTNDPAERDAIIAKTYSDFLRVAVANPAVKTVLTWDICDRFTWLNDGPTHHKKQPNRPQRSLPFDDNYRPKKAFFALRDGFNQKKNIL